MLAIFNWFGYALENEALYRMIKQTGFEGTSLGWCDRNYTDYRHHPELARKAGLFVEYIHVPFSAANDLWLDNFAGEALTDTYLQYVQDCADFELPAMVMHLSSGDEPPSFNMLGLDRIKRIVKKAEQKNVNRALENLRKTEYLAYALGNIDSARLGFCYDSGHHHCRSPHDDLLPKYGSRLMVLHLHDNDGSDDQHLLPFDGTIDWDTTMKTIAATGYNGAISLEAGNLGYEDLTAEEFLLVAYDRAKRLEKICCA